MFLNVPAMCIVALWKFFLVKRNRHSTRVEGIIITGNF